MTDTKISKTTMLIALLALVGALAIAGCGGSGGTTTSEPGATGGEEPNATKEAEEAPAEEAEEEPAEEAEEEPAEEAPAEEEPAEEKPAEEAGGAAASAEGKTIFTTDCGSCHMLQAAGTSGTVGPDLDELEPSLEVVEHQVINGGGPMPAFGKEGTLNPEEVKAVSSYVASVAGKG